MLTLVIFGGLNFLYRYLRVKRSSQRRKIRENGFRIGIDIDGVLADQISPILPRINKEYGLEMTYDDVNEWELKIGNTNIAEIIENSHLESSIVKYMPLHKNSKNGVAKLSLNNYIIIITSRNEEIDEWTKEWLTKNNITYDEYKNSSGVSKSTFNIDILIDDYMGNIQQFLEEKDGYAILFDQPWNQDRTEVAKHLDNKRLYVANDWKKIPNLIELFKAN